MKTFRIYICIILTTVLSTFVSSRAVNISNTWMLPEEGFPVFYRYFRDRISWYEADAVCQFHHANLVTADSTSQYDAIRAYLKEMDIIKNVWIGLSKTTDRPNFTWTNFHPLSGDGYWQQMVPDTKEAICVSMDPAADFLWKFMTCGGPDVASFICELPVPSWAMGLRGCLFTELPSLTVLYIPEQLALELTSDCGLDGTKRVICKGNADREEILRQLTCAISSDEFSTSPSTAYDVSFDEVSSSGKTTKPWTLNTVEIEYGPPTRHRRETEDTVGPISTRSTTDLSVLHLDNKDEVSTSSGSKFEINTNSKENDTLDSTVLDMTTPNNATQSSELTTQNKLLVYQDTGASEINGLTTALSATPDLQIHDNDEFSSAIGQGQLFSIFENGTMFEVNETESNDAKFDHEVIMETPQSETDMLGASTANSLSTTAIYHHESFSQKNDIKDSVKNFDIFLKKYTLQNKYPTKSSEQSSKFGDITKIKKTTQVTNFSKDFSKEILTLPITDSQITLNRTLRKELPHQEFTNNQDFNTAADLSTINNKINGDKHGHIEMKWDQRKNKNLVQMNLIVTTKRIDSTVTKQKKNESNSEAQTHTDDKMLLPKTEYFRNKISGNTSNTFLKVDRNKLPEESVLMKKQFLPKSFTKDVYRESEISTVQSSSSEPLEPEPQAHPRPNRQRQLTRPQRRSFYPYFFSRVLG